MPPLVLLHGFPHDRTLWTPQLNALAVPVKTFAPNLRGFGDAPGTATTMDDYASDIEASVRAQGLGPAVIVGLSMGGYVAFALWRRAPELFRALVLADTRATPDDAETKAKRTDQIAFVEERGSAALADKLIQGMVGKTTRRDQPELVERVHAMLARASVPAVVGGLTAMRDRVDSTPTLGTITVPTLVIVGEEDVLTPVEHAQAMQAGIAGSRLEVIAGAGHLSNVERPAAFNHVLSEFLAPLAYS